MNVAVGDLVCDCRFKHLKVVEIDEDGEFATLEDGFSCSIEKCLDPVPHPEWIHPEEK